MSSNNVARDWPKGEIASETSVENLKKGRIIKDDRGCHLINIFMAEQPSPLKLCHSFYSGPFREGTPQMVRGASYRIKSGYKRGPAEKKEIE